MSSPITRAEARRLRTTDAYGDPTSTPQPKVVAAATGAGVGGALSTLGVWIFETTTKIDLPLPVEGSILVLITAGVAFAAGWIKRPGAVS
jgi:hypothetical protein